MLTVKAVFEDGEVEFVDEVPFSGRHQVLVTFLDSDCTAIVAGEKRDLLIEHIRESGLELTPRELEVLELVQQGILQREVAEELDLSRGTVRNYMSSIYKKLDVRNKTEAIKRAVEIGLLSPFEGI